VSVFGKVVKGRSGVRCDTCGKFSRATDGAYTLHGKVAYITSLGYYGLDGPEGNDICEGCAVKPCCTTLAFGYHTCGR
jgi:hypothetical protein